MLLFYTLRSALPHCPAIASAIPANVRLLSFALSGLGPIFHIRCSLPSTTLVCSSAGNPLSHRHVLFVSPCPNCHGWMIWFGFLHCVDMMQTGFSIATSGAEQFANSMKKSTRTGYCKVRAWWKGYDHVPLSRIQSLDCIALDMIGTRILCREDIAGPRINSHGSKSRPYRSAVFTCY